jgi:hypothetical protein
MHHGRRFEALERLMRPVFADLNVATMMDPRDRNAHPLPEGTVNQAAVDLDAAAPCRQRERASADLPLAAVRIAQNLGAHALNAPPLPENRTGAQADNDLLMQFADSVRLIRAADGRFYAGVSVDGRLDYYRLESDEFRRFLLRHYHEATGTVPREAVVANVVATLRSRAEIRADVEPVFLRVARDHSGTAFLVDLGDPARRAVRIGADGWELIDHPGVPFWRPSGQHAFPAPARGGSIELLRNYVNLCEHHWPLLLGWLTAALRPRGPYPVLVLMGEQGSAKTTLAQVCRRLVDPHAALLRSLPRQERDLMVSAHNNWLLAFDNISHLTDAQSDALCRLSTGGGFAARGLYSDDRELVLSAQRPVILNGIDDFITRADLTDRSIFLSLPRIPPDERRSDEAFWAGFERDYAELLGAVFDAVSGGIRLWPAVELETLSRLADLDRWGEAVMRGLGAPPGTFVDAYHANRRSACADVVEQSPVATALVALLARTPGLETNPNQLLRMLTQFRPRHASAAAGWPTSPWALSKTLRSLAAPLRETGILVAFGRGSAGRLIRIARARTDRRDAPE